MEKVTGIVTELKSKKVAKVKITRQTMCGENCSACGKICKDRDTVILAENKVNAKVNDRVRVQIPIKKGFEAMLLTYGVPLLYAVVMVFCMGSFMPETIGAVLLLAGIVAWFVVLWLLERKGLFITMFKTEIQEILEKQDEKN